MLAHAARLLAGSALLLTGFLVQAQSPTHVSSNTALSVGGRVDWSNVRSLAVYDKIGPDGYFDVFTMTSNGGNKVCLTCGKTGVPQLHNGNPAWDPTGSYILFQSQDPSLPLPPGSTAYKLTSPGWGTNNNLWLTTSDGNQYWQLTTVAANMGVLHPHFSHSGTRLFWAEKIGVTGPDSQWTLKIADLVWISGVPQLSNVQLIQPLGIDLFYESHDFSPDDSKLLFSAGHPSQKSLDVYTYDLNAGVLTNLTNSPTEWDEHAHYTLDGKYIVWGCSRNITNTRTYFVPFLDYWIMNPDGSNQQRLTYFNDPSATAPEYYANGLVTADFAFGPSNAWLISNLEQNAPSQYPQYNIMETINVIRLK